jgi:ATP synthase protein I
MLMRPIRTVLRWQLIATAAITLVAAILWGGNGAVSAALGGAINLVAGAAYGGIAVLGTAATPGAALRTMLRAEAVKVLIIIVLLWLVLASYQDVVAGVFLGSFIATVAIFAAAIAVREADETGKTRDAPADRG